MQNKIQKRGIGEKIGRFVGGTVNILTGRTLFGFFTKFIPSNVGLKTMNSLDIERILSKNLERVRFLTKHGTDSQITRFLNEIARQAKTPRILVFWVLLTKVQMSSV